MTRSGFSSNSERLFFGSNSNSSFTNCTLMTNHSIFETAGLGTTKLLFYNIVNYGSWFAGMNWNGAQHGQVNYSRVASEGGNGPYNGNLGTGSNYTGIVGIDLGESRLFNLSAICWKVIPSFRALHIISMAWMLALLLKAFFLIFSTPTLLNL